MGATPYEIGRGAEFDLLNKLFNIGYIGKRAYKSQGPYDLMVFRDRYRPLLIEVKYYKGMNDNIDSKENTRAINRLKKLVNTRKLMQIAKQVQAYPLLAFKIRRKGYLFHRLDTEESYMIKYKNLEKELAPKVLNLPPKFG